MQKLSVEIQSLRSVAFPRITTGVIVWIMTRISRYTKMRRGGLHQAEI